MFIEGDKIRLKKGARSTHAIHNRTYTFEKYVGESCGHLTIVENDVILFFSNIFEIDLLSQRQEKIKKIKERCSK